MSGTVGGTKNVDICWPKRSPYKVQRRCNEGLVGPGTLRGYYCRLVSLLPCGLWMPALINVLRLYAQVSPNLLEA
jgi:hypothetical protein